MMQPLIHDNISLKPYNSFAIDVQARHFVEITEEGEIPIIHAQLEGEDYLVLGGGSNILFTENYPGTIVKIAIPGMRHSYETAQDILVTAGAGVVWNDLVWYCVGHKFHGIENLALIPGTVGAAPIQNIGAYGTELMDVFERCRAYDTFSKTMVVLTKQDCQFSYRDSIFKQAARGRYLITEVTLRLTSKAELNVSYGAIQEELVKRAVVRPTLKDIALVVSAIRTAKLPDPSTIGNAGSFFKNPIIRADQLGLLKIKYPEIIHYEFGDDRYKIAAGWLIEQCGWKGKRLGEAGTWKNQALVLVNHGKATGHEMLHFARVLIKDVQEKFNITLVPEVNLV